MDVSSDVILALDKAIRPVLSEGRAGYHFWLSTSTFFVGFGVVLEAFEIFRDVRKEFSEYLSHRRRRISLNALGLSVVRPEGRHLPWVITISLIGWFMVAAGVVGEFRFDDKVSEFDATLQMIDNEILARADLDSSAANERAGNLEVQAETLRKEAEDEHMARVRLQERVAWRTIQPSDIASIGLRLRSHHGIQVFIGTVANNEEAIALSDDLTELVNTARWSQARPAIAFTYTGEQVIGLDIFATRDEPTRAAAHDLSRELGRLKLSAPVTDTDRPGFVTGAGMYIRIGLRPRIGPLTTNNARTTSP